MDKTNKTERVGFKAYFGTSAMASTCAIAASLMQSFFMLYLTDYSGMGAWAASFGTGLLVFARIFDAVNDPLEGWIMDRAKVGKYGKYKPFVILSILMQTAGIIGLFFIPSAQNPFLIGAWIIGFYLVYDIGTSFYAPELIYRTITQDDKVRGKLVIGPRLVTMAWGMVISALIATVNAVNGIFNNMHTAFGVTVAAFTLLAGVISLIGILCVKEKHHAEAETGENVKLTDFFSVIKNNDALLNRTLGTIFCGFIWNLLFAAVNYYVKWAYCADLTTGAVNTDLYGLYTLITSMMMFSPLILGIAIAPFMLKKFGSAMAMMRALTMVEVVGCALIFVLHIVGILPNSPFLLFACMAVVAVCMGALNIPQGVLSMEVMDYEVYKNGRDRAGLINAVSKLLEKAQAALSTAAVGSLLVAFGYIVDSATDTFIGDLSNMPSMLTGFTVISGLLPAICGLAAFLIWKKYPINAEVRAEMSKALNK